MLYRLYVFRSSVTGMAPLFFKSHSVAVVALSGVSHVACKAPDDSFSVFLSPSKQEPLRPPNNKNIIF